MGGLEQGLGDEFAVDFDEFDEFGGGFSVCSLPLEMRLVSLEVFLMSWMSLGCVLCVFAAFAHTFDEFGKAFDEFGRGLRSGTWR